MSCCIKSTNVTVSDIRTKIVIDEMILKDRCCYTIVAEQPIPQAGIGLPLFIQNGETRIPIWLNCCSGYERSECDISMMTFMLCQLKQGCKYPLKLKYVNTGIRGNPEHFVICNPVKAC